VILDSIYNDAVACKRLTLAVDAVLVVQEFGTSSELVAGEHSKQRRPESCANGDSDCIHHLLCGLASVCSESPSIGQSRP
jgi:hypothetical protein